MTHQQHGLSKLVGLNLYNKRIVIRVKAADFPHAFSGKQYAGNQLGSLLRP
jgi:hypothetical protein